MKQQGRDAAPEAAAVAFFYFAGPSRSLVIHGTEIHCSQILEAEITGLSSLLVFFHTLGEGRGRKVALVRVSLLRGRAVPLWAAL